MVATVPSDQVLVESFLATLERASPSTRRQRAWALTELLTLLPDLLADLPTGQNSVPNLRSRQRPPTAAAPSPAPSPPPAPGPAPARPSVLDAAVVTRWLERAAQATATGEDHPAPRDRDPSPHPAPSPHPPPSRPASLPGLRARASAVRALARYAEQAGHTGPDVLDALTPALRLPTPLPAPGPEPSPVRHLLSLAHPDARPRAVHPAVWTRFCAHLHLLALTGEREDVMATLPLAALEGDHLQVSTGLNPRRWRLGSPARTAVAGWLTDRTHLIADLRGAPPTALWVRARPSVDRRTGAVRPAGLPLSDRGLRLAFTSTVHALGQGDPGVAAVGTSAVRRYARGRGPTS